jgi:hypothetical protein
LAVLVLSACSAATHTGAELEQRSSESSFISSKSDVVALSLQQARKVMIEFGKSCYDGYKHRVKLPNRTYGGILYGGATIVMEFKADVTNEDGRERFVVWKKDHGVIQLSEKTEGFLVMSSTQLAAAGEGTKVISHHVFQYGNIHDKLVKWMRGDTSKCL